MAINKRSVTLTGKGLRYMCSNTAHKDGWDTQTTYNATKENGQWLVYNHNTNNSAYVDETCIQFVSDYD